MRRSRLLILARSVLLSVPLSALLLVLSSVLSRAEAQSPYFGLHLDVVGRPNLSSAVPLGGLQLGVPVLGDVELRVSGLTLFFANFLQVDVLYTRTLSDTLRGYGGGGGDVGSTYPDGTIFGVHATAGLEYGVGSGVGLFGEVQPLYVLSAPAYLLGGAADSGLGFFGRINLGVNVHF